MNIIIDFEKGAGLVPVIVQDADTKEVLMQAYAHLQHLMGQTLMYHIILPHPALMVFFLHLLKNVQA
mgnify:CR=1 FL=1